MLIIEYLCLLVAFLFVDTAFVRICSKIGAVQSHRLRKRHGSVHQSIIKRETSIHLMGEQVANAPVGQQVLQDSLYFVKAGMEAIIEDEVTGRFRAEQPPTWNFLTRTKIFFSALKVDWKLALLWAVGVYTRYFIMLPLRLLFFCTGMSVLVFGTALIGLLPECSLKRYMNGRCMLIAYAILSHAISAKVQFHNPENRASGQGICVANHTTPLDALILSIDNVCALVGQRHSGILGIVQRAMSRSSSHIWFDREEVKDRAHVIATLREHDEDEHKLPILLFPEGTCINNTCIMMFKKGSFEIGAKIYPIAMKYDLRYADAFWNSSAQSWLKYILELMTSWAIICDVWYLPAMEIKKGENAIDFASRVKKAIADRAGLVDLDWDGQLKRSKVPQRLVESQQKKYYQRYSRFSSRAQDGCRCYSDNGLIGG